MHAMQSQQQLHIPMHIYIYIYIHIYLNVYILINKVSYRDESSDSAVDGGGGLLLGLVEDQGALNAVSIDHAAAASHGR